MVPLTDSVPVLHGGSAEEQSCLRSYATAVTQALSGTREMIEPLRGLIHADVSLADEVWARTLKAAWVSFPERRRVEFVGAAGALLVKPWHTKSMNLPPLVQGVQSVSRVASSAPQHISVIRTLRDLLSSQIGRPFVP